MIRLTKAFAAFVFLYGTWAAVWVHHLYSTGAV